MKKTRFLIPTLCLLLLLAGCGAGAPAVPEPSPGSETETALVPLTPAEEITYEVVTERYEESVYSDDGEALLMTISFAFPQLQAYSDGVLIESPATAVQGSAMERTAAFNDAFAQWRETDNTDEIIDSAKGHYEANPDWFSEDLYYSEELTFTAYRAGSLISVAATYYSFLGGAHPNTVYFSWNFDLDSGIFLTIPELAKDPQAFTLAIADMIEAQAAERFQNDPNYGGLTISDIYWSDYRETMEKWASDCAAAFDADGLTVIFSAYELAPYAEGAQEFHIPYATLSPYWSDSGRSALGLE